MKKTHNHTPGPWSREGLTVYALMFDSWKRGTEVFRNRFFVNIQLDRKCTIEEAEATARLIAAAPDLLEALEAVTKWATTDVDTPEGGFYYFAEEIIPVIDAAIAKAKGES